MLNTFTSYDLINRDIGKAITRVSKEPTVDRDTQYYLANITKVKSIDEFVKNDRLFRYAMKAHGLEDMTYAKAFMTKVLKEGVDDSNSFANRLTDKRYAEFAADYNFVKYGDQATTYNRAQVDAPKNFAQRVELGALQAGFTEYGEETGYYLQNIQNVTSIDDLMADDRLLSFAMAGFGLDSETETPERIRSMLEGGVTDPNSPANKLKDKSYANFVAAFNFVEKGTDTTKTDAVLKDVPLKYAIGSGIVAVRMSDDSIKAETAYFKANISKVKSATALMADKRLLSYAMAAYGLDADTETTKQISKMLSGGVQDPNSPANLLSDKRYANFVAAFNFEQYGDQATTRDAVTKDTVTQFTGRATAGWVKPNADYVKTETAYYKANVSNLHSIDDLMNNKRLLNFALAAYGLDPAVEKPETIRKMLQGGTADANSPANQLTDKRYAAFVSAFNFKDRGENVTTLNAAQKPTVDKYLRQTLEEEAGEQNQGVQLALYFQRKAPNISTWYSVLADKALMKVMYTAFNIPDSFAQADVDKQVAFFESKFKVADLKDPKKLGDLMKRFTSLWELNNGTSTPQASATSVLYGQSSAFNVSTDLMLAMQRMKF